MNGLVDGRLKPPPTASLALGDLLQATSPPSKCHGSGRRLPEIGRATAAASIARNRIDGIQDAHYQPHARHNKRKCFTQSAQVLFFRFALHWNQLRADDVLLAAVETPPFVV
jgi:hypothetical protein